MKKLLVLPFLALTSCSSLTPETIQAGADLAKIIIVRPTK